MLKKSLIPCSWLEKHVRKMEKHVTKNVFHFFFTIFGETCCEKCYNNSNDLKKKKKIQDGTAC